MDRLDGGSGHRGDHPLRPVALALAQARHHRGGGAGEGPPLDPKDGAKLAVVAGMVCAWVLGPVVGVSPAAAAVLGALVAGTIRGAAVFRAVDWDLVVFSAGTLSFGYVLLNAGTAGWLGSSLFPLLDRMGGSGLLPLGAFGVFVLLRLFMSSGVSYSAVVFSILLSMEPLKGLEPLPLALVGLLGRGDRAAPGAVHTRDDQLRVGALWHAPGTLQRRPGSSVRGRRGPASGRALLELAREQLGMRRGRGSRA